MGYHEVIFTVEGEGRFPIDMLRYDRCCPATESDSNRIECVGKRRVTLLRFSAAGTGSRTGCGVYHGPTVGRWESFGWRVVFPEKYRDE